MDLIEDLDPEEERGNVDPALKLVMEAAQYHGGYVARSTGEGIFALFGVPLAHEDHPLRALLAGLTNFSATFTLLGTTKVFLG